MVRGTLAYNVPCQLVLVSKDMYTNINVDKEEHEELE
jgi:hypothetical protein